MPKKKKSKICFFFTKLPRVLRDRIYELVCRPGRDIGSRLVRVNEPRHADRAGGRRSLDHAVQHIRRSLAVSRQFYEEVARYVFPGRIILGNAMVLRPFLQYITLEKTGRGATFVDEVRLIKARYITEVAIDTTTIHDHFDEDLRETLRLLRDQTPKLCQVYIIGSPALGTPTNWNLGMPTIFDVHGFRNVKISFYKGAHGQFLPWRTLDREHLRHKFKSKLTREAIWSLHQPQVVELECKPGSNLSILDLPVEIRRQILKECLTVRPHDPDRWVVMHQRKADSPTRSVLEVLLTCRAFYLEACDLFYSQNVLCFKQMNDLHLFVESINPRSALDSYHAKVLRLRKQSLRSIVVVVGICLLSRDLRISYPHDCKQSFIQLSDCANLERLLIMDMRDRLDDQVLQQWSRRCKTARVTTFRSLITLTNWRQKFPDITSVQKRVAALESTLHERPAHSHDQAV